MSRVTYQMDQKGTAPLLRSSQMQAVLKRRADTGAAAARRETDSGDRVDVRPAGTGRWSDRSAVDITGPAHALHQAVDAVERG